jgi:hypothetical protein
VLPKLTYLALCRTMQHELPGSILGPVHRQPRLPQGVRLGVNFNEEKTRFWVRIHPGGSGPTHQQVLDRFLGRAS